MYKFVSVSLAAMAVGASVSAQDMSGSSDARLVTSVTLADMQAIVTSLGHDILSGDPEDVRLVAQNEDGQKYVLDGTACNDARTCQGINMYMTYDKSPGITLTSLNEASLSYAAVSVWLNGDSVGISRYVMLDEGMAAGNIKVNIRTLVAIGNKVMIKAQDMGDSGDMDFGDDSGSYAFDDTCDDVRFTGPGRSILLTDSHIRKDATDCRTAYTAGTITLK